MATNNQSSLKFTVMITVIIIAIMAALVVLNNQKTKEANGVAFENAPSLEGQPVAGEESAPVTVVEFGDFKCPSCKIWTESIYPKLQKDYIDSGKVNFSFINVLFHGDESELASLAAETVYKQNPDVYWDFHEALFKAQPSEDHDSQWVTVDKIKEVASSIDGLDTEKLMTDIEQLVAEDEVKKDTEMVKEYNIQSTPTIMVNGVVVDEPFDYEKVKEVIDKQLEGK